jgi:hypothetical protein
MSRASHIRLLFAILLFNALQPVLPAAASPGPAAPPRYEGLTPTEWLDRYRAALRPHWDPAWRAAPGPQAQNPYTEKADPRAAFRQFGRLAVPALIAGLADADPGTRFASIHVIDMVLAEQLTTDDDRALLPPMLRATAGLLNDKYIMSNAQPDWPFLIAPLGRVLSKLPPGEACLFLVRAADDPDPASAWVAEYLLPLWVRRREVDWSEPETAQVVAALMRLLKHSDSEFRTQAAQALGRIGPAAQAAIPSLRELATTDPANRSAAEIALKRIESAN